MGSALKREALEHWLRRLGQAWEQSDAEGAALLFDPEVIYRENPFAPPLRGFEAVKRYWLENLATQRNVVFSGWVLAVDGDVGVVNWRVEFTRVPSSEKVRLDGLSVGRFSDEGRPLEWREWWHREGWG
jgi:hypothetical protein